jgi:hypothetical protein
MDLRVLLYILSFASHDASLDFMVSFHPDLVFQMFVIKMTIFQFRKQYSLPRANVLDFSGNASKL